MSLTLTVILVSTWVLFAFSVSFATQGLILLYMMGRCVLIQKERVDGSIAKVPSQHKGILESTTAALLFSLQSAVTFGNRKAWDSDAYGQSIEKA